MDIAEKSDSIFGVWRRGSEANTTGEKKFGDYRPEDADNNHKDNWWYDAYYGGRSEKCGPTPGLYWARNHER